MRLKKNEVYNCLLRHDMGGELVKMQLRYVNESDCNWRTIDDNSELNWSWNVIQITELTKAEKVLYVTNRD